MRFLYADGVEGGALTEREPGLKTP